MCQATSTLTPLHILDILRNMSQAEPKKRTLTPAQAVQRILRLLETLPEEDRPRVIDAVHPLVRR